MTYIHPADRAFGSPEEYSTPAPREALVSPKHFPAILLPTFMGGYGIDRMYIGRVGLGIAKLLTFSGFGIWALVNSIIIAKGNARDGNPLITVIPAKLPTLHEQAKLN